MLQTGRHRASTHEGVEVTPFHACAFAASGRPHSYWHAAHPMLRPLSSAQDIFSRRHLRASAFGMCVLICDVLCQIQGQLARAAGFPAARPARRMYPNNLPHGFSSTACTPLALAAGSPHTLTLRACQTHVQRAKNWIQKIAFQVGETGRNLPAHPRCGPPKKAHPSSKRIGWIGSVLITWATCWLGRGAGRVFCPVGRGLFGKDSA